MKKLVPYVALAVVCWLVYVQFQSPNPEQIPFITRWDVQRAALPWLGMFILAGLALFLVLWLFAAIYQRLLAARLRRRSHSLGPASVSDRIHVQGWTASELRPIAADFARRYDLPAASVAFDRKDELTTSLWFPGGIGAGLLMQFIGYLRSPDRFEIRNEAQVEALHVVGVVTITPGFRLPDQSLVGRRALIYAPSHERRLDLYVAIPPRQFFEFSLRRSAWIPRADARMDSRMQKLWEREISGDPQRPKPAGVP